MAEIPRNLREGSQERLWERFANFGELKYFELPKKPHNGQLRGFGVVEFADPSAAIEAHELMNGVVLKGRELVVMFDKGYRKSPSKMTSREKER